MLKLLIQRELHTAWRNPQRLLQPLLFFILTLCLFPIALGIDEATLRASAPAALWLALLLAALLAGEQLFYEDYHDGTLSQDRVHLEDLWLLPLAKLIAAWLRFTLPLLLCLPLMAMLLHIKVDTLPALGALIALGSLSLLLIAMLGAALTVSQAQSTFLLFLIVVPLYIPVLILGVSAANSITIGLPFMGLFALLGAFALFAALVMIPFATLALKTQNL
ncbi:heme exporter protein CcmB [Suttonella sp. R2A3]|uniref:heme exporter protein CcmB n=1 Tax=Suttonella sp. R2A3 TaxID=2908648 RepID=UPI001F36D31A|nr:heme exporter protein CcmB [Suttonella sp. R2A3]UJF24732.1 heme exporter protein CcmB [Suttonella sp. R2A3]